MLLLRSAGAAPQTPATSRTTTRYYLLQLATTPYSLQPSSVSLLQIHPWLDCPSHALVRLSLFLLKSLIPILNYIDTHDAGLFSAHKNIKFWILSFVIDIIRLHNNDHTISQIIPIITQYHLTLVDAWTKLFYNRSLPVALFYFLYSIIWGSQKLLLFGFARQM